MFLNARRIHIKPFDNTRLLCSLVNLSLTIFNPFYSWKPAFFKPDQTSQNDLPERPTINLTTFCFPPYIKLKHSLFQFFLWCLSSFHHVPLRRAWLSHLDNLLIGTGQQPSDSSHRVCTLITWPSWWPSTELALVLQCLSCTGGPKLDTNFAGI